MVAFDHRNSLRRDLDRLGVAITDSYLAALKMLIWQGIETVLADVATGTDAAVLVNRGHRCIEAAAMKANVVVAVALEASGCDCLQPDAAGAELAADLRALKGGFGKVLLRWHPADDDSRKRRQLAELRHLAELAHDSGARLLIELLVPPSPADLASIAAADRYDEVLLPGNQHDAVDEILNAGVVPAMWKLEGHTDTHTALALADLISSHTPSASILVLGGGVEINELSRSFAGGVDVGAFNGFAVGRSIWWQPIAEFCRGRATAATTQRAIGDNYLAVIETFEAASQPAQPATQT